MFASGLSIDIALNGQAANATPGPTINPGSSIEWTYKVTNTGDQILRDIELSDDRGTPNDLLDDLAISPMLADADSSTLAERGTLETSLDGLVVSKMVVDPLQPRIYASVTADDSIVVLNTESLAIEQTISVGKSPRGMALSLDGTLLYVSSDDTNTDNPIVAVVDLVSGQRLADIPVDEANVDVKVGADGRLFVLGQSRLMQVDPATGDSAGNDLPVQVNSGELAMSLHRDRLYYANYGEPNALLAQFDVTSDPPAKLWESPTGSLTGRNGQDLAISADGSFVSYAAAVGQGGYRIAKYDTENMDVLGNFVTGAYPREIAFSADNAIAYTVHTNSVVGVWDTETFDPLGEIPVLGQARELVVDSSGKHLFAAFDQRLRVRSTGRQVAVNVGDTNSNGLLDPNETWLYSASDTARAGAAQQLVTAASIDADGSPFVFAVTSHYTGALSSLELRSTLNGQPTDPSSPPIIRAGEDILWQHTIINQGSVSFADIQLAELIGDLGSESVDLKSAYVFGDTNFNSILDAGESWRYEVSGTSMGGQHDQLFEVTALLTDENGEVDPNADPITAQANTYYAGLQSELVITLLANGQDTSSPGPEIGVGDRVVWAYYLTNPSEFALSNVALTDNAETSRLDDDFQPEFLEGDTNSDGKLDPDETWVYLFRQDATFGPHARSVHASATDILDGNVQSTTDGEYIGVGKNVDLTMSILDADPDAESPPTYSIGDLIRLQYFVSNSGATTLGNPLLLDDNSTPANTDDDRVPFRVSEDEGGDGVLSPGETWEYRLNVIVTADTHVHRGRVSAVPVDDLGTPLPGQSPTTDQTQTQYIGADSQFSLDVVATGTPAKVGVDNILLNGELVEWKYSLTNTGNVSLNEIVIVDDLGTEDDSDDLSPVTLPHSLASGLSPRGTSLALFDGLGVAKMIAHPTLPYVYGSVPSQNSIAIFNTQTLQLESLVTIGTGPSGLALTPSGDKLYVANSTSQTIGVLDTATQQTLPSISVNQVPSDVEVGADGRLFVLGHANLMQISPVNGEAVGITVPVEVSGGELAISPDRTRLYYGNANRSPASLYQIDVSAQPPVILFESPADSTSGGNGLALTLSPDGQFVSYVTAIPPTSDGGGAGQGGHRVERYQTSDMTSVGAFVFDDLALSTFPRELTLGPDNLTAYSVTSTGELDVWNAATQQLSGQIDTDGQVNELFVDPTARFLFASYDNELVIYSTGRASISLNQGDVNFNRQVDPGETWLYGLTSTVETGEFTHNISADANDILATTVSRTAQVSYTGADRVSLAEQVAGEVVFDLTDVPVDAELSDPRFELIDNQVRLKSGEFLISDTDDELELVLRTSEPESEFIRMIVLDVTANTFPWQNAVNRYDVTGNTVITAVDSLTIINELERRGVTSGDPIELGPRPADRNVFYDVSGDGRLSALDALLVINELNRVTPTSEPMPASEAVAASASDSSPWDWLADRNRRSRLDAANIDMVFSQ